MSILRPLRKPLVEPFDGYVSRYGIVASRVTGVVANRAKAFGEQSDLAKVGKSE